jgi:glycosyltransferase involved in cell wall biosynthesis
MPTVSVVIPAFNSACFIAGAIQSVQEQTFRAAEIIVVDDGSADDTEKVVRALSGPVTISYQRVENGGAARARNAGVRRARGEWIAFLDADDLWHRDKLERQLVEVLKYPDGALFYSDFEVLKPDGTLAPRPAVRQFSHAENGDWKKLAAITFRGRPFPFPSTVLLRKSVFTELGGFRSDMRGKYYEDFELFARVAESFPIYFIEQNLVRYRLNPKSQREMHCTPNVRILLGSLWQLWREQPKRQAVLVKHYAYHYSMLAKYALQDGDYLQAREYYGLSFRYFPGLYLPWNWKNLRRWALCYMPGVRRLYRPAGAKGPLARS